MDNPFIFRVYQTKELFCDRQEELKTLITNTLSGADTTLIAQRRIGKTGLIYRLIDEIRFEKLPVLPIYVDIFATRSLEDFVKALSTAIMNAIPEKSSIGKKFAKFIRSLRPLITYDPLTSTPQIQLTLQSEDEQKQTLTGLLTFLDNQDKKILLAIDEFQQIREYPEQNMEALLRTYIQQTRNLTFIYCGSKKHLMADIFTNEKKPFYSSTTFVSLGKIDEKPYGDFICHLFNDYGRNIDDEALQFILEWTRRHTYYTQQLCHTVFAAGAQNIDINEVKAACDQLMKQGEAVYLQYRQMLTVKQWSYLIAVAKEGCVSQITSAQFLGRYKIGTASASQRLAEALTEKGLLNDEVTLNGTIYSINDVFLSHWMERL